LERILQTVGTDISLILIPDLWQSQAVMLQVEDLSAANRELASKLGRLQVSGF